jgi:hypothetical protein
MPPPASGQINKPSGEQSGTDIGGGMIKTGPLRETVGIRGNSVENIGHSEGLLSEGTMVGRNNGSY